MTLTLQPTVDIFATVAALSPARYYVGIAAESQDVERLGEEQRQRKQLPLMIASRSQDALGREFNEETLLDDRSHGAFVFNPLVRRGATEKLRGASFR